MSGIRDIAHDQRKIPAHFCNCVAITVFRKNHDAGQRIIIKMRVDLCLKSHITCFYFLFFGFGKLCHGIFQIVTHKLKCLIKFLEFIDRHRVGCDFFLTESVKFHALNNVFQVFDRPYDRTRKPIGNQYRNQKKGCNNCQENLKHLVDGCQDERFRLNRQIGISGVTGICSRCVFCLSVQRTGQSDGSL